MRITADTNILVRASIRDEASQTEAARHLLETATQVVIPVTVFCEFAWVLGAAYRYGKEQVGLSIRKYLNAETVVTDRQAVEAGLAVLVRGGDFADGAVAHQGRQLGGVHFATFDTKARKLLASLGFLTVSPFDA